MSEAAESLLASALNLPVDERLELAETLMDSIPEPGELPFHPSWVEEIRRRSEALDSGQVATIPWSEVRRKAREAAGG